MSKGPVLTTSTHSAASRVAADNCRSGCASSCTSTLVLQPWRWAAASSNRAHSTLVTMPFGQAVTMANFMTNPLIVL